MNHVRGQAEHNGEGGVPPEQRAEGETASRAEVERAGQVDDQRAPEGPTDLGERSRRAVLKRAVREFREDNLTDWAAALTYYSILAIFPALLALISVLGLLGDSATQTLLDNMQQIAPGAGAGDLQRRDRRTCRATRAPAGVLFFVGLGLALWSASGYVAGFMRASNDICDVEEGRPIWKTLPTRLLTTLVLLIMLAARHRGRDVHRAARRTGRQAARASRAAPSPSGTSRSGR